MWHEVFQGADASVLPGESLIAFMDEVDAYVETKLNDILYRDLCLRMRELAAQIRMLHVIASGRGKFDPRVNPLVQELCGYRLTAEKREMMADTSSARGAKGGRSTSRAQSVSAKISAERVLAIGTKLFGKAPWPRGAAQKIQDAGGKLTVQRIRVILKENGKS